LLKNTYIKLQDSHYI